MIQDAKGACQRHESSVYAAEWHAQAVQEAFSMIEGLNAVHDPAKIDRLASQLMMQLDTYERGRELGLGVVAELRAEARRLGFSPKSRAARHS